MAERLKAPLSKSGILAKTGIVGSNPTLSAIFFNHFGLATLAIKWQQERASSGVPRRHFSLVSFRNLDNVLKNPKIAIVIPNSHCHSEEIATRNLNRFYPGFPSPVETGAEFWNRVISQRSIAGSCLRI